MQSPKFSVKLKLLSVVVVMGSVAVVVGGIGFYRLSATNTELARITDVYSPTSVSAAQIRHKMTEVVRGEKNLILASTDADRQLQVDGISEATSAIEGFLAKIENLAGESDRPLIEDFREEFGRFLESNKEIQRLVLENSDGQALALSEGDGRQKVIAVEQKFQDIADMTYAYASDAIQAESVQTGDVLSRTVEANGLTNKMLYELVSIVRAEKNHILAKQPTDKSKFDVQSEDIIARFSQQADQLEALVGDEYAEKLASAREAFDSWIATNREMRELSGHATHLRAQDISRTIAREQFNASSALMDQIMANAEEAMATAKADAESGYTAAMVKLIVSSLVGIALGLIVATVVIRQIISSLTEVADRMSAISAGKLNLPALTVKSQDELGALANVANEMQQGLNELVKEIVDNATQVAAASTQVSSTSDQLASSVDHQRVQLGQVSAAVEELSTSIGEVASRSQDVSSRSTEAGNDATEGGRVVSDTVDQINAIAQHIEATGRSVSELSTKAEQIGESLTVINDIADQTNLLALNAAIEAARAGEHGRGFAVVADEVRKLAERTTEATQEVASSITEIQTGTSQATEGMATSQDKLAGGVELAQSAGKSLEQIVRGSQEVSSSVDSIAAAVEQQSAATSEIAASIERTNASTSEASEAAAETSSAAGQLSSNAERLRSIVSRFEV